MKPQIEARNYGLIAEFASPEELLIAAETARREGFTHLDAYTPFPVEGLAQVLEFRRNRIPLVVLLGGLAGGIGGYFMLWYATNVDYPINVGGRPFHSWPMYLPITFELIILGAAFAAVLGMLGLNGLPRPHHPVFAVPGFERATRDRFFLCVMATDPLFESGRVVTMLETLRPIRTTVVPA